MMPLVAVSAVLISVISRQDTIGDGIALLIGMGAIQKRSVSPVASISTGFKWVIFLKRGRCSC
jgi:hypothetical protein